MNNANAAQPRSEPTALVTGADGFIAGFIIAALRGCGWRVLRGVRQLDAAADDQRLCDLTSLRTSDDASHALRGVDAVVNVAGILRETATQRFDSIHYSGPLALARACVSNGVGQFVQISALGQPEDGNFVASKQRFDEALLALPLNAVVLRPSVVYTPAGSYGGTSLLRALAALPGVLPLPGDGRWQIQPLCAEDLAQLVVAALQDNQRGCFEVGGPQAISLRDYLLAWRQWLRLPTARIVAVPVPLINIGVAITESLGSGPMGDTAWRMLRNGNVCADDAQQRLRQQFGCAPRSLTQVLSERPSQVQDRWHARLYLLAPALRAALVLLFLISAWAGWVTPASQIEALTKDSLLASVGPTALARVAAGLDLLLAIGLVVGWRPRWVLAAMFGLVAVYTLSFGTLLPALWLDPLGGMAKNLVVLPALAILWVLSERR